MTVLLAICMSAVAIGCSSKEAPMDVQQTMATVEETSEEETTSIAESTYGVVTLAVPYLVTINEDTILMSNLETSEKISDLPKESIVTVIGNVTFGDAEVDFYYCQLDTETSTLEGFVDGKYIDFNSKVEDSMMGYSEVEGGDGEETSEIEAETEEVSLEENTSEATTEVEVLEAEPYIMYVASNCNVRREADKKSELIMTLAKGVEVTCYGTEGDWTQIDCQGIVAYIHTSLLTSTKPASSSTSSTGSSSQSGSTQSQQTQTPAQSTTPTQNANGTISVYSSADGMQLTLTPNGKGWYVDQYGFSRDQFGNDVDPITGEVIKSIPYDSVVEEYQGGVGASYNSGLKAY